MSIEDHIAALESQGKLKRYVPTGPKFPRRRLFLTEAAVKDLESPDSVTNLLGSRGAVEAALIRWTLGEPIYARSNGKCGFLCRLDPPPPEIWDIRVTQPVNQIRLFGRFALPDTLILTKFHTRKLLGDKPNWKTAMDACEHAWNALFPSIPPFSGPAISHYVTEKCDAFPI